MSTNIKYTKDGKYKYIVLPNFKKIIVPRNGKIYKNKDSLYKPIIKNTIIDFKKIKNESMIISDKTNAKK